MMFLNSLMKRRRDRLACEYGAAGIILAAVPFVNYPVAVLAFGQLAGQFVDGRASNTEVAITLFVLSCALCDTAFLIAPHAIAFLGVCMAVDLLDWIVNYEDYREDMLMRS